MTAFGRKQTLANDRFRSKADIRPAKRHPEDALPPASECDAGIGALAHIRSPQITPQCQYGKSEICLTRETVARVLVIEDNAATMRLTTLVLQKAGHTALCAVDAESGMALARTGRPDLILMDILLPAMDGLAATALLKADPATAAIPVIILSAMLTQNDEKKARVAGCDAYIAKPFRQQELNATIDDLLSAAIDALLLKSGPPAATAEL